MSSGDLWCVAYRRVAERSSQNRSRAPERRRHVVQSDKDLTGCFRSVRGGDGVRGVREDTSWLLLSFIGAYADSQRFLSSSNSCLNRKEIMEGA